SRGSVPVDALRTGDCQGEAYGLYLDRPASRSYASGVTTPGHERRPDAPHPTFPRETPDANPRGRKGSSAGPSPLAGEAGWGGSDKTIRSGSPARVSGLSGRVPSQREEACLHPSPHPNPPPRGG